MRLRMELHRIVRLVCLNLQPCSHCEIFIPECFQLCSYNYTPTEKFAMSYLPERFLATGPLKRRYIEQNFLWLFTWVS